MSVVYCYIIGDNSGYSVLQYYHWTLTVDISVLTLMGTAIGSIVSSNVILSAVDISVLCFNVVYLPSSCIMYVQLNSKY
jgi:hypothetical protein